MRAKLRWMAGTGIAGVDAAEGGVGCTSASSSRAGNRRRASETRRVENLIEARTIMAKMKIRNPKCSAGFRTQVFEPPAPRASKISDFEFQISN
jgi:hypothetical protein